MKSQKLISRFITLASLSTIFFFSNFALAFGPLPPPPENNDPEIPNTSPPNFSGEKSIRKTILITKPGVYDYKNVLHRWAGAGDCNQKENQPYILRIASSNVTLKNFAYINAPDGIHIGTSSRGQGHSDGRPIHNIKLINVTGWACEDALTTQYGVRDLLIENSRFYGNPNKNERDKLLQLNFSNVTIRNTIFDGSDTCIMFKGDQKIVLEGNTFVDCTRGVNGSTIDKPIGRIGDGPSTLLSIRNNGWHRSPPPLWDPWILLTAYGDVKVRSTKDNAYSGGRRYELRQGATIDIQD